MCENQEQNGSQISFFFFISYNIKQNNAHTCPTSLASLAISHKVDQIVKTKQ